MTRYVYGERIGKQAKLAVGCNAVILGPAKQRVLLVRRADNGWWCLPGGIMEAGETVTEACHREVWEETGLHIQITRLVGVYSDPHRVTEYADGNRYQFISFSFEAEPVDGKLSLSEESTDHGYFSLDDMARMQVLEPHREQIADALAEQPLPFVE